MSYFSPAHGKLVKTEFRGLFISSFMHFMRDFSQVKMNTFYLYKWHPNRDMMNY